MSHSNKLVQPEEVVVETSGPEPIHRDELDLWLASEGGGSRGGQSDGTEPLACGIWRYLQVRIN